MKNLQEATERICELKGSLVALDALMPAVIGTLGRSSRARLMASFDAHAETARMVLLNADISDAVLATFERDIARNRAVLQGNKPPMRSGAPAGKIDALLLTTTCITTFAGTQALTKASGFFFRRAGRVFLVSNRHVFADASTSHLPDRIEIGLHTDLEDLTQHAVVSLPLYQAGLAQWRQTSDGAGEIDVAALEIPFTALPADATFQAFDETHLEAQEDEIAMGDPLTLVGFSLGFHDTTHHLAVTRTAPIASAYGVRFQSQGCFLTDARAHPDSSGSPVVRPRIGDGQLAQALPWQLLGVHSTRMDTLTPDRPQGDLPGLNCAWYAPVLMTLTANG